MGGDAKGKEKRTDGKLWVDQALEDLEEEPTDLENQKSRIK